MKRSDYLDFSKGILILLVSIGHSIQFLIYQNSGFWDDPLFKSIYMFHMPLFMAISGYLAHRGLSSVPFFEILKSRARSYLVPIFIWALLSQAVLTSVLSERPLGSLPLEFIREAFRSLWFIWALFGGIVLMAASNLFGRLSVIAAIASLVLLLLLPDRGNLYLFKYVYPYFLFGYYTAAQRSTFVLSIPIKMVTILSGLASVVCFYLWNEQTYIYVSRMALSGGNQWNVSFRYLAGAVVSCFALCLFHYAYHKCPSWLRKIVAEAGKGSMYIYIISGYTVEILYQVAARTFLATANQGRAALIGTGLGIAIAAISWLLGRVLAANPLVAELFFGNRRKKEVAQSPIGSPG